MAEIQDTIREIKSKFRLFMNGMVSQSMREKGIDYKLNFGIEYPRIKEIAADYPCSHELAQALWKENIRECKIMAGLLQPVDGFCREIAEIWIEDMRYPELAEYTVMNLFQRLPYASEVVFPWIADEREYFQLCGYLLMTRLLMKGWTLNERAEAEFLDQAFTVLEGGTEMKILKCLLMIVTAPVVLVLTLFVWLCTGLIYISGLVLGLLSTVIALLGVAVLITYSPQNGVILLVMAFLISPMGLPLAAIWLLGKVQSLKFAIQELVYG